MLETFISHFNTLHPAFFMLGLAILPLGPVPVSPLWLLAGMRFGPATAIAMSFGCLLLNFSFAYLLSAKFFRQQLERILLNRKFKIPDIPQEDELKFTFLIRLLPGNPLCVQNYLLGIVQVRPIFYFGIGIPLQLFYATGFIVFGKALFEGQLGTIIFATLLLAVVLIGGKLASKYYLASKAVKHMAESMELND